MNNEKFDLFLQMPGEEKQVTHYSEDWLKLIGEGWVTLRVINQTAIMKRVYKGNSVYAEAPKQRQ
jgi:hypothetical protein